MKKNVSTYSYFNAMPAKITRIVGSFYVSGKLPTYPSPKLTLTLTSHLGPNAGLGEG